MSSLVVAKLIDPEPFTGPAIDQVSRRAGMYLAGTLINDWMKDTSNPPKNDFFDAVYSGVTNLGFKVFYFGTASVPYEVTPKAGNKYEFTDNAGDTHELMIKVEEDKKESSKFRMTIALPRDRGDLIAAGYIPEIVDDISDPNLGDDPLTPAQKARYLLATVFLSRCH